MNNYIQLTEAQKQTVLTQCKNLMGLPKGSPSPSPSTEKSLAKKNQLVQ